MDQSCKLAISKMICQYERKWTYASSKCKLQIVGDKRAVCDGIVDAFVEKIFVAVEVLGNTQPKTEELLTVS